MAINYNEHTWTYGEELTPDNFNNIEKGIKANANAINEVNNNLADILTWKKTSTIANGSAYSGFLSDPSIKSSSEVQFVVSEKLTNYYSYAFTFQTMSDNVLFASSNVDAAANYCRVRYNRYVNGTGQFDILEMKVDGKLVDSSNMSIGLYYR